MEHQRRTEPASTAPSPPASGTGEVDEATTPPIVRTLRGRLVRLFLVLLVLAAEFGYVMWLVHMDDDVQDRRAAVGRSWVLIDTAVQEPGSAGPGSALDRSIRESLTALGGLGALDESTVEDLLAEPATPAGEGRSPFLADSYAAVSRADADLESAALLNDLKVAGWLLLLFAVVCAGWFVWFARLAREHRKTQRELTNRQVTERGERRLTALVHSSSDLVVVLARDSSVSYTSPSCRTVLGLEPDEVLGQRFVHHLHDSDRPTLVDLLTRPEEGEQAVTMRLQHHDGRLLDVEGTAKDLHDDDAVHGVVLTLRDVTERRALEESLAHQAFHDGLTGLANRDLFTDRLEHALERREHADDHVTVLFLDLDDFKLVNDSQGHQAGDALLVAVSQRTAGVLRSRDTAARLGGDEFAVLLENAGSDLAATLSGRLIEAFEEPFEVGGHRHVVRVSIGLASTEQGCETAQDLMRNADMAMYHAKENGKSRLARYDDKLHAQVVEMVQLRLDLAEAIEHDQLVLHYQPTVELSTTGVTGFEALVRWNHPLRGLIFPADFVPEAERSGLVHGLGAWVLREACHAGAGMQSDQHRPTMSVNVAPQQLTDPGFRELVLDALHEAGLPPDRLVLEITETALVHDLEVTVATLASLREHGIRVAIDDFGTGYSSFASLSSLPVDVLKVDKSFVDHLGGPNHDPSLVEAILAMSRALDLVTVAEGVEDDDQAAWLREHCAPLGRGFGQGYLWSRPVDLATARLLLLGGVADRGEDPLAPSA